MEPQQEEAGRLVLWLRERWGAFLKLERTILDLQHRAAIAAYKAQQRGDYESAAEGKKTIERLGELAQLQMRTADQLRRMAAAVPGFGGLGAYPLIPLAWAGAVIATASAVALVFTRVNAEERVVRMLERGQLTAEEATRLLSETEGSAPGAGMTDALKWVAFGLVGWAAVKTLRELPR